VNVVVVHGGGPQIAALLDRVGLESKFEDGLRVTDPETMRYVVMALSEVNVRIVAALNDAGLASVGLCGSDATLLCSESVGEALDRVGHAPLVHRAVIDSLWSAGFTPVINPVALDKCAEPLNCNADTVAGALAAAVERRRTRAPQRHRSTARARGRPDLGEVIGDRHRDPGDEAFGCGPRRDESQTDRRPGRPARRRREDLLANGTRRHALRDALAHSIPTTEVVR